MNEPHKDHKKQFAQYLHYEYLKNSWLPYRSLWQFKHKAYPHIYKL